jgi:hypothetical protein
MIVLCIAATVTITQFSDLPTILLLMAAYHTWNLRDSALALHFLDALCSA